MNREGEWLGDSFGAFLDRIPKKHLLNQVYMFSESFNVEEALENTLNCSHVMFTREFNAGVEALAEDLDIELTPIHTRSTSVSPPISQAERDRLREMLEPEYQLYGRLREVLCDD
jgi:hypothetical protein